MASAAPELLAVKIAARTLACRHSARSPTRSPGSARSTSLNDQQRQIAKAILKEINERLGFLNNVGLDYLNRKSTSGTLSGGESQRIRLASQIGSGLSGVLYVLDEPSIGLGTSATTTACSRRSSARDLGNTVIKAVEHDEDAIRHCRLCRRHGPRRGRPWRRNRRRRHAGNRCWRTRRA